MRFLIQLFVLLPLSLSQSIEAQTTPQSDTLPNAGSSAVSKPVIAPQVYKVGDGVSPPRLINAPRPEYSNDARHDKIEGVCVLRLIVSPDGMPTDINVKQALGDGLDEKAIEAVRQWRFEPSLKDGKPVAAQVDVEVNFHLHHAPHSLKILALMRKANKGNAVAQLELSEA